MCQSAERDVGVAECAGGAAEPGVCGGSGAGALL